MSRKVWLAACLIAASCSPARRLAVPTSSSTTAAATSSNAPTASSAVATGSCGRQAQPPPRWQHVVWIWMENHSRGQVIGPAPATTALARQCATATDYASVGSPSLPNYLGGTSGSTFGVGDDRGPGSHRLTADNIFRQVRVAGGTAMTYAESMPQPCDLSSSGRYAVKHNPAAYYTGADDRSVCQHDDVPLPGGRLGTLPTFLFVVPDLCHDTHDCAVSAGDQWLSGWLDGLLSTPEYRSGTTAVFVVWDEYTPMPSVFIAPSVRPGTVVSARVDHYALLRTTEEMLGLPLLGHAAGASSMRQSLNL